MKSICQQANRKDIAGQPASWHIALEIENIAIFLTAVKAAKKLFQQEYEGIIYCKNYQWPLS